ncbi:MAG TPA: extracellular solute-binding protein [Solirubrobacteraceae bacterium]|jgi:xylobiose transport system substrate-binding protein|nr:extracellular solute-binding protein [Solirubrobacteraceae bacterium]
MLAAGTAIAVSAGASSAKTVGSAASGRPAGKINVLVYGDAQNSAEQYAVAAYNKTPEGHKVKAVLSTIAGQYYQAKLQTIMSSSKAPDVFFNWGGGSIAQFQKAGLLLSLNSFFKSNPKLKSSFLPSILKAAAIGGQYYGIPMRGTQPVMLFYNKSLLSQDGVPVPKTWSQLVSDVSTLKSKGVQTPIALGGKSQWPTLMWFEYLYDRVAGPSLVTDALAGQKAVWNSAASKKALSDIAQLVNAGAFGQSKSWDSVNFGSEPSSADLVVNGVSAFELMGSWDYSTIQSDGSTATGTAPANGPGAAFVAAGKLGYTAFPSVPGGKGNLADLAGNTENYYSVLAKTRYPDAVADFLKVMYSSSFVKKELALGNLTTTKNTPSLISGATAPYLKWQYQLVNKAPAFQLSWDQAYPQTDSNSIHTAVANYFDNLNQSQYISAMQKLQPAS